jgi:hypothetical protein
LIGREPSEDRGHVLSDCLIDGEDVGEVGVAEIVGIPPGQD